MGIGSFCVNFCWAIGLCGIFFLGILAISASSENERLLKHLEYKSRLVTHLWLAVLVSLRVIQPFSSAPS